MRQIDANKKYVNSSNISGKRLNIFYRYLIIQASTDFSFHLPIQQLQQQKTSSKVTPIGLALFFFIWNYGSDTGNALTKKLDMLLLRWARECTWKSSHRSQSPLFWLLYDHTVFQDQLNTAHSMMVQFNSMIFKFFNNSVYTTMIEIVVETQRPWTVAFFRYYVHKLK